MKLIGPWELVPPWRTAACPFCFEAFHLSQAPRRSLAASPLAPDPAVARFLGTQTAELGKVIEPPGGLWWRRLLARVLVQTRHDDDTRKICPGCHMFLPHMIAAGELDSEGIAIIGARDSGKSNFFGVLLHALEHRYSGEVPFTMFAQDTFSKREMRPVSSTRLYRERYGARLFDPQEPRAIDQTLSAAAAVSDVRIPLIYRLQFRKRLWHHVTRPLDQVSALDLAIFDTAGEDMTDEQTVAHLYRFILRAAGIIFLVDPFQYPEVRDRLPAAVKERLRPIDTQPSDIIALVRNLFEGRGLLRAAQKLAVPVAVTLSKCDLLQDLAYPGSAILHDSDHRGGFDRDSCGQVSREVAEYLKRWGLGRLLDQVDGLASNHALFAVSALGSLPDRELRLRSVAPRRVADPLLWLLWQRGYIPARPWPG
jgi:hypothetical protein